MPELKHCSRCRKLFVSLGRSLCPKCLEDDEREFERVKEYLDEHPFSNAGEIAEGTGVPEEKIIEFIKQGRLLLVDKTPITYPCELCKRQIFTGRLCDSCKGKLSEELKKSLIKSTDEKHRKEKIDQASKFVLNRKGIKGKKSE
ncbi:MAG: MerR family transcriptional regulator [bacterium]|nr:MerR family transcriptional regulator [bacterium]